MNKWQIICPVVAIVILAFAVGFNRSRNDRNYFLQTATHSVGRDIIATTNSSRLVKVGPTLQSKLSELSISPMNVAAVLIGDEPFPYVNGKANSRLVLTNDSRDGVVIRLRHADQAGTFHVLGFLSVSNYVKTE